MRARRLNASGGFESHRRLSAATRTRDGWYDFAERHGTNVTALLEATGVMLGRHAKRESRRLPAWLQDLLAEAQLVASSRSGRRRSE
jgi:hypothetical protein